MRFPNTQAGQSRLAVLSSIFALSVSQLSAQTLIPGDLVVSAYGTPSSTGLIDGQAVPISLQVFAPSTLTTDESPISTTVLSGIVGEYGSSSEGNIQLTGNGQYLTIGGYNAAQAAAGIGSNTNGDNGNATYAVGTPYGGTAASGGTYSNSTATPLGQSSPADVARVADVIDSNGQVVSTTSFSNLYNTNNPRAVYSPTGSSVYISGQGDKKTTDQGIFYSTAGASYASGTTTAGIYNAQDTRYVTGYNGNLYYSLDKKNSPTGIFQFTGSPTTSGSTATQLIPGTNGLTGNNMVSYSPEGFWFANADTLYVADTGIPKDGGVGDGGIQKWTLTSGTWTLDYTLTPGNFVSSSATTGETGFEAITGSVVDGIVDLFAVSYTAADDNPNGLYAIADTLSATTAGSETFTELASSPGSGQENFKGVSFDPAAVPEPSTWMMILSGMSVLCVVAYGQKLREATGKFWKS